MRRLIILLTCLLPAFAAAARAEGDPNAAKGLVVEHCIACHEVPGYGKDAGAPAMEAISFSDIARDRETYTTERLRSSLSRPHWPMGKYQLSPSDIDNIVAFIESLAGE